MKFYALMGVLSILLCLAWPAQAERLALVIGNSDYQKGYLKNPVNDAADLGDVLEKLGFRVIRERNLSRGQMLKVINDFALRLRQSKAEALVYFSGHGMQYQGRNYLIPIGAMPVLKWVSQLEDLAVSESLLLNTLRAADNPLNIVIIDACRNNPLKSALLDIPKGELDHGALAAPGDTPNGFLIAYATASGKRAFNGKGRNSPYVSHLMRELQTPDEDLEIILRRVRKAVHEETGGEQQPAYYAAINEGFVPWRGPPSPHTWREPTTGMRFVKIPGGCFDMGSPAGEAGRHDDEGPVHEVCVDGFWLGQIEVTNA